VLFVVAAREDRGQVLRVGEQSDDVDVILSDEVEPAAREVDDAADA
jgi:hypothetical protein